MFLFEKFVNFTQFFRKRFGNGFVYIDVTTSNVISPAVFSLIFEMHSISIQLDNNISDGEVFDYSTVFLKGRVVCDHQCQNLNGILTIAHQEKSQNVHLIGGRFKAVVELIVGHNTLKLTHNDDVHSGENELNFIRQSSTITQVVQLFYIVPKDDLGTFQSLKGEDNSTRAAQGKIVTGGKLLQTLIAERLNEQGFGRKTFCIDSKDNHEFCRVFQSSHTRQEFHDSTSEGVWNMTAMELLSEGVFTDGVKALAFLSCTEYFPDLNLTKGFVACGRGHLAMVGSSGLHSWASTVDDIQSCLTNPSPIDPLLLDDIYSRKTMGGCYSTSLGAALHELGHVFDLVHSDCGIMARGFNEIDLFFTFNQNPRFVNNRSNELQVTRCNVSVRPPTKVTSVCFGLSKIDKDWGRDGEAYFHRSAVVLLSAHPWFRPQLTEDKDNSRSIEILNEMEIRAANGLRLIELHEEDDRLVKYWDFTGNPVPIRRYHLNVFDVRRVVQPSVLIQDTLGNILRQKLY